METREIVLWVALGAVGLGAAWSLVRVSELQTEVDILEVRLDDRAARAEQRSERKRPASDGAWTREGRRGKAAGWSGDDEQAPSELDLDDPEVVDKVEELVERSQERQLEERRAMMAEHRAEVVADELEKLAETYDLEVDEVTALHGIMEDFFATVDVSREAVRSGEAGATEMRAELRAAREEAETRAAEVVGEEAAAALWAEMPRGSGMGMGGGRGGR